MPERKRQKRPERRGQVAALRLQRFMSDLPAFLGRFSGSETDRHKAVIRQSLGARRIDWGKIAPSVEYLRECRAQTHSMNRKMATFCRSFERAYGFLQPEHEEALRDVQEKVTEMDKLLEGIKARRKAESG